MPNTYTQIFYHIVFSTKNRARCIAKGQRDDFYRYVWGIHKNLKCHLYRIGGVEDHMHIFTSIHPFENVKTSSTSWIRRKNVFHDWPGWQDAVWRFHRIPRRKGNADRIHQGARGASSDSVVHGRIKALLEDAGVEYDPNTSNEIAHELWPLRGIFADDCVSVASLRSTTATQSSGPPGLTSGFHASERCRT